jgi:hypothetical protein
MESFSNTTFTDSSLRSYSLLNKNFMAYKLNQLVSNHDFKVNSTNNTSKDVFLLETTKNFLSNSTDLDILNNLTELKRDDVTSLKYFQHLPNNTLLESNKVWS